jgi:hypothetical protein
VAGKVGAGVAIGIPLRSSVDKGQGDILRLGITVVAETLEAFLTPVAIKRTKAGSSGRNGLQGDGSDDLSLHFRFVFFSSY